MSCFTAVVVKYETMAYRLLLKVKVVVYTPWARFCK